MQDWEKHKSTKYEFVAKVVAHHLKVDDAPAVICSEEGIPHFPQIPVPVGETPPKTDKIIIYQEFTKYGPLLQKVSR